jgi:hypothetical protein
MALTRRHVLLKVDNVPNGIVVGNSIIQSTIVATGSPAVFLGTVWSTNPRVYRNAERGRFGASRLKISRFGSVRVLAAVGAKLQVVQAWCECDGL